MRDEKDLREWEEDKSKEVRNRRREIKKERKTKRLSKYRIDARERIRERERSDRFSIRYKDY